MNGQNGQPQSIKHQLDFLYKALDDTQNTIRFTDTKAAAIIAFAGSFITITMASRTSWMPWLSQLTPWYNQLIPYGLIIFMSVLILGSVWLAFRAILPKTPPNAHVINGNFQSKDLFYLHDTTPDILGMGHLLNDDSEVKLKITTDQYVDDLSHMSEQDIRNQLVYEIQKVSFIRRMKIERVNKGLVFVRWYLLAFVALVIYGVGRMFL